MTQELRFSRYIGYVVINESFDLPDEHDEYTGKLFRTYSHSSFLDYIRGTTWALEDSFGPITHYGIVCLNHTINVAAVEPPQIRLLRGA